MRNCFGDFPVHCCRVYAKHLKSSFLAIEVAEKWHQMSYICFWSVKVDWYWCEYLGNSQLHWYQQTTLEMILRDLDIQIIIYKLSFASKPENSIYIKGVSQWNLSFYFKIAYNVCKSIINIKQNQFLRKKIILFQKSHFCVMFLRV